MVLDDGGEQKAVSDLITQEILRIKPRPLGDPLLPVSDQRPQRPRNIYVNAGPGCGKTVLALKVMHQLSVATGPGRPGLAVEWCANNGETAARSGGLHIFDLFRFRPPENDRVVWNADQ